MTRARHASRAQLARATYARRLGLAAAVALVAASVAVTLIPGPAPTARPAPAPARAPASTLGVYAGPEDPSALGDFVARLGTPPRFATDFVNGASWSAITQSASPYSAWQGKGYTMIWGITMLPNTYSPNSNASVAGGSCNGLAQGATGAFDSYFRTVAQNIVSAGFANSIIRLGWEFNGGWLPWAANGCASAFVTYFDHIVSAMRSVPGEHLTFEWNPTRGDLGVGDLASYYPGDAYVDYVGLDIYDVEWQRYPGAQAEFQHIEAQKYGLEWLASFAAAHHKPMAFPEWGLGWGTCSASGQPISAPKQTCGGDDAAWINLVAGWIASHNVYEVNFWDYGSSSVDQGQNPLTAFALAADFGR